MTSLDHDRPVTDPLIGQLLGKDYRVLERIGTGGMGVVYLVEHAALKKRFAAKVLSSELAASAEARARFQTEAHAASQLEHENIVTITDYGLTADARPYIVMEFLRGRTLDARLLDGPLTLEEIVAIIIPVARALAEAHAEGIVHRDVKPENVFLTLRSGGRWGVKVLDFGIAKAPIGRSKLTKMGQALGSPMYMAPEACKGEEVDHRADIYSLGVLMYLLWCGRVPFEDDNVLKVLQMQVSDPVTAPRYWRPDMSPELEAVILRALEKDPDHRFLTMTECMHALEHALPAGADRLLVEAARGTTVMRAMTEGAATPFPEAGASQRMARVDPVATAPTRPSLEVMVPTPAATAATTLAPEAAAAPRSRRGWMAVAAIALLGAGAALALVLRGEDGASAQPAAATAPSVTPAPVPTQAPAPDPTRPTVAEPIAPAAPQRVALTVTTTPPGATVFLDDAELGTTPFSGEVERSDRPRELRLEQPGFEPWRRAITVTADASFDAALVAVAGDPPARPPRGRRPKDVPRAGRGSGGTPASGSGSGSAPGLEIRTNR
ncbi:MAG: serine/threonine protein kinase [Kofleriaceae bacterium]|jgi:tRNA A-37 threonylcarbamoyl transferase component Bud32|nr:serine/threonine protein kinase [Kofleriaceae bacterium]MBP9172612.1 serine/threonine protein kinase [Kofleriaceae bacterium]MBP9861441.1 serine/threonine protein kinase [Kofleriaceae bacterium]